MALMPKPCSNDLGALTQLAQFGGGFRDFAQVDASRIK
jgi:hypothetical protein